MTTLTIKVNERSKGGKAFLQLVDFFNSNEKKVIEVMEEKSPYSPEFVAKIRRAEKQKSIKVNPNDIWGSLGLK